MSELNICVLGAGVIGLTTAIELQNEFRNATITLLAENFNEGTTSFVAPALFFPGLSFKGPTEDITKEWIDTSFYYWNDFLSNNLGSLVGIAKFPGYLFSNSGPNAARNTYIEKLIPGHRILPQDELERFPGNWKFGSSLNTLVIENGMFLPWATNKFLDRHGTIKKQKIENLSELAGKYDIVVNCTGMGARVLCQDMNLRPIRGQIYKVDAPWVDKFYCVDDLTCIVPGFEGVTLGTTRQFDSFDENYDPVDELDIKQRCEIFLPKLRDSKIIAQRVGFRPHRNPVRIEYETMCFNDSILKVVHNYGHSGNGVTAAPGTAKYAAKLVREALIVTSGK